MEQIDRLVRVSEICGDKRRGIKPLIAIGKSTWWEGCKSGRFPAGRKLSDRVTVWRLSEIKSLIEQPELLEKNRKSDGN